MNKIADIATNENGERQTPTTKIKKTAIETVVIYSI